MDTRVVADFAIMGLHESKIPNTLLPAPVKVGTFVIIPILIQGDEQRPIRETNNSIASRRKGTWLRVKVYGANSYRNCNEVAGSVRLGAFCDEDATLNDDVKAFIATTDSQGTRKCGPPV